ncbi:MAG TPA: bifunctional phosphopantothenoylcysteine decarboxylase/phosphopantothenate--cysteine ligase CoaBC [Afifellaceae bacterium]|nr:bifunctional phosphopantothenoylcysteine decarboxylase/phosphopantothenate--cysteine ligase CoaBC [Afifellaceae bacterium]
MNAVSHTLQGRRILLIIGGGIAAYKVLELIRRLKERGAAVRAVMSGAAKHFVTPLSVGALTGEKVYSDLFDLNDEHDIGHIRLSREADLLVVAPATADLLAKMANGLAVDLASTVLMATDKPVLTAPAMNPFMWSHPATQRNVARLAEDGIAFVGPEAGEMAESGEAGVGRMAEPMTILAAIEAHFANPSGPLAGRHVIVTSGPTHEPIDPVRYIANRSSGRQGHAIAEACARAGATVTLVSGPVEIAPPAGVKTIAVESARQMMEAVEAALPADIAVMAAAVADWRVAEGNSHKIKKEGGGPPKLDLVENPDILATVSRHDRRPALVIGFAAETRSVTENASAKLDRKGCDWIVANDVSPETGIMGGANNRVHLISKGGIEDWPDMPKEEVAERLAEKAAAFLKDKGA